MTSVSPSTFKILALSMLKGVGPSAMRKAASLGGFHELPIEIVAQNVGSIAKATRNIDDWNSALEQAHAQVDQADRWDARILSPLDPDYPKLLATTKDDPFLIFVRGRLAEQGTESVAVIGTREPTAHGAVIAERIAGFFISERWSVVSGLAMGCDALAHQAALDWKGHTVAVLAHGLHTIAPARHRKLAEDIVEAGGALVSEYRFGQAAQPQQFVKRDRIQAGMAQGVVMVQSDLEGGSLHASRAALEYGRWLAVPYPTDIDRDNNEPKIQANLLIAEGTLAQREQFLRCAPAALKNVFILRGREDYRRMTTAPLSMGPSTDRTIGTLL